MSRVPWVNVKIASPIYKHGLDLRTGRCLDDPPVQIAVHAVRVRDRRVEILDGER